MNWSIRKVEQWNVELEIRDESLISGIFGVSEIHPGRFSACRDVTTRTIHSPTTTTQLSSVDSASMTPSIGWFFLSITNLYSRLYIY